jgi:hypothetical protein
MAQIAHPQTGDSIDVEIIDREEYRGTEVVQVEATDDGIELSDESGEKPWVEEDEVTEVED